MNDTQFLLYQTEAGQTRVLVRFEGETAWLSQAQMAELFQTTVANINIHIKNIYEEGELSPQATIKEHLIVRREGERQVERGIAHYNLDVIISVGYRVRSHIGTQFRIWATQHLREYILKGFVLDDQRLKEQATPVDYFDELLERIRDIRSSEKIFYKKVCDIYATSIDYSEDAEMTEQFFQTVQNKFHYGITGKTAPEIIAQRADADKPNMGLSTWSGDKVRKKDVTIAKNYYTHEEAVQLGLIVEQYLAFAELQARTRKTMYMKNWISKLHDFLTLNERDILKDTGKVSRSEADTLAAAEFQRFEKRRRREEIDTSALDKAAKTLARRSKQQP